jgi:Zn-dependent peptidase ImmA (M78 family)
MERGERLPCESLPVTEDKEARRDRMLEAVFGPGTSSDASERARQSRRLFVRGLDLLTVDESERATGRRLTAWEAYSAYGFQKLWEVVTAGAAIISDSPDAAGRVLRERRAQLDIPVRTVASKSGLTPEVVEGLERSVQRPVREYERVARVLGLDERVLSFRATPQGNEKLTVRLRTLAEERASLSPTSVASLAEAAWVAMTQIRLEAELGLTTTAPIFETSSDYGFYGHPAYEIGYELADEFRDVLDLGTEPILSMRELVEERLHIPVIQVPMDERIAGATVESAGRRAVVLNIQGLNSDALVRRSTMAHEVGHLLFDPSQHLDDLRVDEYEELDQRAETRSDPVEQRANAFAVQLLAPQRTAVERFEKSGDLFDGVLDYFGLSFTAGRYQVWNGLGR